MTDLDNTFMDLCKARQSCRNFSDKPVEHEKLLRCIETASLAPSGCNAQPWSFVVVEKPELLEEIASATQQLGFNEHTNKAKAFIVVIEEHAVLMKRIRTMIDSQYFAPVDIGISTAFITLQAQALGLGTCILGMFDREKICNTLNIPIEKKISLVIAVGYPADDKIRNKQRKSIDEIVRFV